MKNIVTTMSPPLAWLLLFFVSLGDCGLAFAGETVTASPITFELRDATSHPLSTTKFTTVDDCIKAAPVPATNYLCIARVTFSKTGTCDDVPMPAMPTVVDENGYIVRPGIFIKELPDGSWGPTMQEGFVTGAYPNCWVAGLVPYVGEFHAPEGPPDMSPGPWVEGSDYPIGSPCPAAANGNCYAFPRP